MDLLEHLPPYLQDYDKVKVLMDALQPEMDALEVARETVWKTQYINQMPEETVARWEKLLGLIPPPERTGYDQLTRRKQQLKIFANLRRPYGFDDIDKILQVFDPVTAGHTFDASTGKVTITLTVPDGTNTAKVGAYITRIATEWLPAWATVQTQISTG